MNDAGSRSWFIGEADASNSHSRSTMPQVLGMLGLPSEGYVVRHPSEKAVVRLTSSDVLEPRLIKIQARYEESHLVNADGSLDTTSVEEIEMYRMVCALRYIKRVTLGHQVAKRGQCSGLVHRQAAR